MLISNELTLSEIWSGAQVPRVALRNVESPTRWVTTRLGVSCVAQEVVEALAGEVDA